MHPDSAYHLALFAAYLEKLRTTPDGDGSLLDHMMLLYGGGISNSDCHTHGPLPTLLLGGGAGAFTVAIISCIPRTRR